MGHMYEYNGTQHTYVLELDAWHYIQMQIRVDLPLINDEELRYLHTSLPPTIHTSGTSKYARIKTDHWI